MNRRAALVTGATGFIGRALVDRLLDAGYPVTAVSRSARPALSATVRVHVADLATGAGLAPGTFHDVGVVFHCAGEIRDTSRMRPVHVDGTRRLLASLSESSGPLPHWVQLSSVGAYGPAAVPSQPRTVDESTPENPIGEYEATKTESDTLVREFSARHGLPVTLLRPSSVVGARMSNASVRAVIAAIDRGWYFHIGKDGAIANYVHVDDVADALVSCAANPAARGQTFNLSSDCPWATLVEHIASARGVPAPRLRLPEWVVRGAIAAASPVVSLPLTASRIGALVGRTHYPATKIENILGFRCSRPMPAGIDDVMGPAR